MSFLLVAAFLVSGAVEGRDGPRLRGAIGLAGAGGYAPAVLAIGLGGGITFDVGATFNDREGVLFRGTLTTAIIVQAALLSANYEFMLGERIALSTGLGFGLIGGGPDQAAAFALFAPARATFLLASRPEQQLARRGFALFVEFSPGVTVLGGRGFSDRFATPLTTVPIAVMAAVGASYVWW